MSEDQSIKFIRVKNNRITSSEGLLFKTEDKLESAKLMSQAYKFFGINYSKFFKMDGLSKAGFIAAELLSEKIQLEKNTGLIFSNSSSSLDTDLRFQESMQNFASPSVFVYTLPNIVLGEISIRHSIQSENAFFITEKFDPELMLDYAEIQLKNLACENVLCGWLNLHNNEYDVFLWHVAGLEDLQSQRGQLPKIYATTHE
ncbi:3-oxoacyl-ACP synthase [uncultured Christiangramia sp.]|uniref:3-oxoacyl-ACP synthase n=1 Tax=Christiangramia sp. 3-2217-3z TaxID=3417564 RepID=UPI00262FC07F|nr:3-oxoacyl-ACP synthase [uncultured Christiangramia sp.]